MGGYETINRRYGSFILRLKILVITADLFYTDTLLSRKMQLLWPRTIFSAITSDIPRSVAQNSFCGAVIVWERQLPKLEICADAWEIVPAHCHQISLIIQFLSDFVGELLPDCVYECLWTVPLYLQFFSTKEEIIEIISCLIANTWVITRKIFCRSAKSILQYSIYLT